MVHQPLATTGLAASQLALLPGCPRAHLRRCCCSPHRGWVPLHTQAHSSALSTLPRFARLAPLLRPLLAAEYGCFHPLKDVLAVPYDGRAIVMLNGTLNKTVDQLLEGKNKCVLLCTAVHCCVLACLAAPTDVRCAAGARAARGCSRAFPCFRPRPAHQVCMHPCRPCTLHASMCTPPSLVCCAGCFLWLAA
jgi:hypothetical protein